MKKYSFTLLSLMLLQGCANQWVPKNYEVQVKIPENFYIDSKKQEEVFESVDILQWWEKLKSPQLSELILKAQENNSDIAKARVNIKNYETQVVVARAKSMPSVVAIANATRGNSQMQVAPAVSSVYTAGVQTSWEIDLLGFNNLNVQSKLLQVQGAQAQLQNAHTIVAAEVARSYFNYKYCLKTVELLEKDYNSRIVQNDLTKVNVQFGLVERASLSLSQASIAQSQTSLVDQKAKCEIEVKGLVSLTGESEPVLREKLKVYQEFNEKTLISPLSIPSELIQKRPDIYASYKAIEAKAFNVAVAKGENYPSISFSGSLLANKLTTGGMSISGNTWSLGPLSITLPIFDNGVIKANEQLVIEDYESSKKEFLSTVRNAIREIETVYIVLNSLEEKTKYNQISIEGFNESLEASLTRYNVGLSSLYELEDARRAHLNALSNSIVIENTRVNAWIDLYKAVGGGFYKE